MELIVSPSQRTNVPIYTQDTASELVAWYQSAVNSGQTTLPSADCGGALPANVASVVLRAIMDTHADVTICCKDQAEVKVYAQMYNFWFAGTKAERIETD